MSLPITALRRGQCRFAITPHSALIHRFCAEPVEHEKSSYCPRHAAVCFDRRSLERRLADNERMEKARASKQVESVNRLKPPARVLPIVGTRTIYEGLS